jgi:hypothetical protein
MFKGGHFAIYFLVEHQWHQLPHRHHGAGLLSDSLARGLRVRHHPRSTPPYHGCAQSLSQATGPWGIGGRAGTARSPVRW